MGNEKNFEEKVKRYLKSIGVYPLGTPADKMTVPPIGYFEKRWGGGTFTKSGLPDMHIVVNGYSVDVELKAETGRISELQKFVIKQIRNAGGFAFVLYPSGYSDFVEFITDLKREIYNRETTPEMMKGGKKHANYVRIDRRLYDSVEHGDGRRNTARRRS